MAMSNKKISESALPWPATNFNPTQQKHICQPHDDTNWQLDTNSDIQNSKSQSEI